MNTCDLMNMLVRYAKEYTPIAIESVIRNKHMNKYCDEFTPETTVDALIVDFVNFVGVKQGMDLGLYTSDLGDTKEE